MYQWTLAHKKPKALRPKKVKAVKCKQVKKKTFVLWRRASDIVLVCHDRLGYWLTAKSDRKKELKYVAFRYEQIYGEHFSDHLIKEAKPEREVFLTIHAEFRCAERMKQYSKKQIIMDIKKGRKSIRQAKDNKFSVRWQLWTYIMTKDFMVVTMY